MKVKKTFEDYAVDIVVVAIMIFVIVVTLYPFLNSLAISLNDADDTTRGGITLYPRIFTLRNYELVFSNEKIYHAYFITIARTVIGTVTSVFCTGVLGYALSHKELIGRRFYTMFCLVPMWFSGGLLPYYFLIKWVGLTDNFMVYIIPGLIGLYNMILMRTYFSGIPDALEESARIDGANFITIFFKIIIPLSSPIIATIALFVGVGHWNAWFDATMFITKQELKPMQNVLLSVVSEAQFAERIAATAGGAAAAGTNMARGKATNVRSITMATMIITILPIIMIYPFLQRYFIKGIMIGSVKG